MPLTTALDFSALNSRVDCGGQLPTPAVLTIMAWINLTTSGGGTLQGIVARTTNRGLLMNQNISDAFELNVGRITTDCAVRATVSSFAFWRTNAWLCLVGMANTGGANSDQKLLLGDTLNFPKEPSSYNTQAVGSGTVLGWDANLALGAVTSTGVGQLPGKIAAVGIWNYALTSKQMGNFLREMLKIRPDPKMLEQCQGFWQLGRSGAGPQVDWSRTFPAGVVTSAVATAGVSHSVWG